MAENLLSDLLQDFSSEKTPEPQSVQDLIPLVDILEGMYIVSARGKTKYVKLVEITAANFSTKEPAAKRSIISSFEAWLKIAPERCQIKTLGEPRKTIDFVEKLKEREAAASDERRRTIIREQISHIERQLQTNTAKTRYFMTIEYEPEQRSGQNDASLAQIASYLNGIALQAREFFEDMGNSFVRHEDENVFHAEMLYKWLNRYSSKYESVKARAVRVLGDAEKADEQRGQKREYPDTAYTNILSPMGLSAKSFPDCLIFDKTYTAYYYITGQGYPVQVPSGWLTEIFSGLLGVDIDIFYRKLNKKNFLSMNAKVRRLTRIKGNSRSEEAQDLDDIANTYEAQMYMQRMLGDRTISEEAYYVATVFTVHAFTYAELKERCAALEDLAKISQIEISDMKHFELEGFRATLPFNEIPKKLYKKARRNLITSGLAGFYPFTAYELSDPDGIYVGLNLENRTLCTLDVHNSDKYSNGNITVLGGSGSGKTFTMALLAEREVLLEHQVYIITSKKSHEFRRLCDALDGKFLRYGTAHNQYMNRYDIRPKSNVRSMLFQDEEESWLLEKLKSLSAWYQLLFRNLTEEEMVVLDRATKDAYYAKGITEDNSSIFIVGPEKGALKEMPVITDVIAQLEKINENERTPVPQRLFTLLCNFTNGTYAGFNEHTNVSLDKDFLVFDISAVPERIEAATVQSALDFIWERVKENPLRHNTIIIEEGWTYLSRGASEAAAKQIQEIFKVIRGYGGSVILATQEIEDILASEYGKSIIACSSIKVLLGVEEGESEAIGRSFRLQPGEAEALESFTKGRALLLAGRDHVFVQFDPTEEDKKRLTTDKRELAAIMTKTGEEHGKYTED